MKSLMYKLALGVLIAGIATSAYAQRPYSGVVTYFDATGAIIGVDVVFCTNSGEHAGVQTSPYYIYAEASCGASFPVNSIVPGTGVGTFSLPGAETISTACQQAGVQCLSPGQQPATPNYPGLTWESGWVNPTISF